MQKLPDEQKLRYDEMRNEKQKRKNENFEWPRPD